MNMKQVQKLYSNRVLSVVAIVVACIVCYASVPGHEFITAWDDGWQVINKYTESFSWYNIKLILTDYYFGQYSPVNQFFYTLIYYFFGYNSTVFHLFCLLLHILNSLLVYFIVRRLLQMNIYRELTVNKIDYISFIVALLFAIHPLQVEVVAWISASKILVFVFFYLCSIWFYLRYIQKERIYDYLLMLLCFLLSFGGKEQAVTLLVCLFWIDFACRRNFRSGTLWYEKMPVFLLTLVFVYITLESHASTNSGLMGNEVFYPFMQRCVFACYSICEYVIKLILPFNLLYLYPFPITIGEALPFRFLIYPVVLLILGFCFGKLLLKRPVYLGLSWFLIHVGLMLHIIPMSRFSIVADRYVYLAAPGLFFIIVWYFFVLLEKRPRFKKICIGVACAWLLFFGIQTHIRTFTWHDNTSLKMKMNTLLKQREEELHKTK